MMCIFYWCGCTGDVYLSVVWNASNVDILMVWMFWWYENVGSVDILVVLKCWQCGCVSGVDMLVM